MLRGGWLFKICSSAVGHQIKEEFASLNKVLDINFRAHIWEFVCFFEQLKTLFFNVMLMYKKVHHVQKVYKIKVV